MLLYQHVARAQKISCENLFVGFRKLYLVNYNECQHDIKHTLNEHRAELNDINNTLDKLNDIFVKNKKHNIELNNIRNRLQQLEYNSLNF